MDTLQREIKHKIDLSPEPIQPTEYKTSLCLGKGSNIHYISMQVIQYKIYQQSTKYQLYYQTLSQSHWLLALLM